MRKNTIVLASLSAMALALTGCASTGPGPAEPMVPVMPGKGKSYERFQRDDARCQAAAAQATGYRSPGEEATNQAIGGAVIGTAVGALAGAAIGAAAGNAGAGAAIGAGSGLAGGAIVGGANAGAAGGAIQGRYDTVYAQCMTAKGHRIDGGGPGPVMYEPAPVVVAPPPVIYAPGPYWGPRPYYRRYWY